MNRALLVGINAYPGNELRGCVNDVTDMADFLVTRSGFKADEIRLLVDDRATTDSIHERLDWLVSGLQPGDRVLFHYSGHGAQFPVRDAEGQVVRIDECICPVDFDWSMEHALRDKQFYEHLSTVPDDVEFIWVSDSCFSGGMAKPILRPGVRARTMPMPADIEWRMRTALARGLKAPGFVHVMKNFHVVLVSGCTAKQTSADAMFGPESNPRFNGALTRTLLDQLASDGTTKPLVAVVREVHSALEKAGFDQDPQLAGAADLMKLPFLPIPQVAQPPVAASRPPSPQPSA